VQRSSTPHIISIVMEQLRSGMRGACVLRTCWLRDADVCAALTLLPARAAARLPPRMPFEALRAHAASRLFK
jgi:hypothetical protein